MRIYKIYGGSAFRIAIGILMLGLLLVGAGAVPVEQWNKTFGGVSDDEGMSVQQTSDGYVLAGFTGSYGAGFSDAWLIKTDADGSEQWNKTFGGTSSDVAFSIQQTSDGYVLAGYTRSYGAGSADAWLIKTGTDGSEQWNKTFGGGNDDEVWSVQKTSDGGFILAGSTYSYGVASDAWLIKTNASGIEQWNKTFDGLGNDYAYSVQQTTDNGYILTGTTNYDAWLIKTDASGNHQWNRTFGGADPDAAYSIQQLSDGYILAGCTVSFGNGDCDFWLIKTDTNGNETWNRTFGGAGSDVAWSVQGSSQDGFILAGATNSNGFGSDAWLVKTDASGNEKWNKTFGRALYNDQAFSVRQTTDGYILAGYMSGYGAGGDDAWLIKVTEDSTPNSIDSCTIISAPGEYVLTQNITSNATCISINSSNVIFDGAGYTIDGTGSSYAYGVYVYNSTSSITNVTVKNLKITYWRNGIYYLNSKIGSIVNNIASSNIFGVLLAYGENNTVANNNASLNDYGIYLGSSSNNTISNNIASWNTWYGIYLGYTNNNTISDNNASLNYNGIYIFTQGNNNTITNNTASLNRDSGIFLVYSSNNNILTNNIASLNTFYGLALLECNNNTLTSNTAISNGIGFVIYTSNNNTISNNTGSLNDEDGINFYISSNNTLSDNIASNNQYGIRLSSSSNNTIYDNILNNTKNVEFSGLNNNVWNITKSQGINIIGGPYIGGNFWAYPNGSGFSQTCTDNADGICNEPYVLDANNTDYLPLIIPAGYSYIYGTVSNNTTGIAGAIVTNNANNKTTTDSSGIYSLLVPAGTYNLTATKEPGYYPNTYVVIANSGTTAVQDIELFKKPTGNITGNVTNTMDASRP